MPVFSVKNNTVIKCHVRGNEFAFTPQDLTCPVFQMRGIVVFKNSKENFVYLIINSSLLFYNNTRQTHEMFSTNGEPKCSTFDQQAVVAPD